MRGGFGSLPAGSKPAAGGRNFPHHRLFYGTNDRRDEPFMRNLMLVIMVCLILGILAVKPFDRGSGKSETPPPVIQQPEPK